MDKTDMHVPPPEAVLMQMTMGKFVSKAISVIATLGVADHVAGPTAVGQLASATGANADALYRVLRALAAVGLFAETAGKKFALTPVGEVLRTDHPHSMRAMCRMLNDHWNWSAWGAFEHSVRTGESAFQHVFHERGFDYFAKHPEESRIFGEAMTSLTLGVSAAVVEAYDFSSIEHVVDVGGSHGILASAIVARYPQPRATLFDLPHVIEEAKPRLAPHPHAGRIATVAGSFFEPLPKADAYIMKSIIHDWDDASCVKILTQCRTAMKPGGRVLIVESIVTDAPQSAFVKLLDLEMLAVTPGGRERTEPEYAELLRGAGLVMTRVVPTRGPFSVIEGRAG
ncbi:MAG TPA: methyltransferase [Kofleriaceae bacterium]|nr:methyltransferase [Kofleriaceae bacterium]